MNDTPPVYTSASTFVLGAAELAALIEHGEVVLTSEDGTTTIALIPSDDLEADRS